jgi:hypothetical protein
MRSAFREFLSPTSTPIGSETNARKSTPAPNEQKFFVSFFQKRKRFKNLRPPRLIQVNATCQPKVTSRSPAKWPCRPDAQAGRIEKGSVSWSLRTSPSAPAGTTRPRLPAFPIIYGGITGGLTSIPPPCACSSARGWST